MFDNDKMEQMFCFLVDFNIKICYNKIVGTAAP